MLYEKKENNGNKQEPLSNQGIAQKIIVGLVVVAAFAHLFAFIQIAWLSLSYPYEQRDWFEWNFCLQSYLMGKGNNPYPLGQWDHAIAVPYTFLMQAILSPVLQITGPKLWVGRLFSMACFCTTAVMGFLFLKTKMKQSIAISVTGMLLITMSQSLSGHTIQKFHPNAFSLFLGVCSLYFSPLPDDVRKKWLLPVLFGLASAFSKQPGIIFLIAVLISCFAQDPTKGVFWTVFAIVMGLVVAGFAQYYTKGGFWFYCFKIPQAHHFKMENFIHGLRIMVQTGFLFVLPALPLLFKKENWKNPIVPLVPVSLFLSLLAIGKIGSTESTLLFVWVPLAIPAAQGIACLQKGITGENAHFLRIFFGCAILLQTTCSFYNWPRLRDSDIAASFHMNDVIKRTEGEVLALVNDQNAFEIGKPWYTSGESMWIFNLAGVTDFPEIISKLSKGIFKLVIINSEDYDNQILEPHELYFWLDKNYVKTETVKSIYIGHPAYIFKPKADLSLPSHH